jgi:adenylate cyclase class 2
MTSVEELEVDILEIDVEDVTAKLESLGAKKLFEGQIDSVYFDFCNKSLDKDCKILRLRKKGKTCTITLKQKAADNGDAQEEYEIVVANFEKARVLIESLGLVECQTDSRERICYKLRKSDVNINIYDNIPPFLEVKSPSEQELKEIVKLLGFSMSKAKCKSEKDVVANYEHIFPTTTRMP